MHLIFGKQGTEFSGQVPGAVEIHAEGLFDHHTIDGTFGIDILLETSGDRDKDRRGQSHVEEPVSVTVSNLRIVLELGNVLVQLLVRGIVIVLAIDIGGDREEIVELGAQGLGDLDVLRHTFMVFPVGHLRAGVADDMGLCGEEAIAVESVQGRESLFLGQIARCTQDCLQSMEKESHNQTIVIIPSSPTRRGHHATSRTETSSTSSL